MLLTVLIAIGFSLGFFIESVVGFGGSLIAYAILGFFIDLKQLILAGIYIGTCSSLYIACGSYKFFDKKIFTNLVPFFLVGIVLGVMVFSKLSSEVLGFFFGILLILLAIKTTFFDKFTFSALFKKKLIFAGGVLHGAFGTGGPFLVNALKGDFKNKSTMRATMAVIFVVFNLVRILQLGLHGQLETKFFVNICWAMIPVFLAIKLGHLVHLKISDDFLKKAIGLITFFAGIKFLVQVF